MLTVGEAAQDIFRRASQLGVNAVKASHGMALETILEGFYKQFQNTTGVSG